jgi:hypothetical protein
LAAVQNILRDDRRIDRRIVAGLDMDQLAAALRLGCEQDQFIVAFGDVDLRGSHDILHRVPAGGPEMGQ